jgi:hypothetical protein
MMRKMVRRGVRGLERIGATLLLAAALPAAAVADGDGEVEEVFQYAAKFVCGESVGDPDPVTAGEYATTINLRNPTLRVVGLRALVLASYVGGAVIQPVETQDSELPIRAELEPLEARQVGCEQFLRRVPDSDGQFVEGWVVILARRSIDVAAVYTSSGDGDVAMDVEAVSERVVARRMQRVENPVRICHVPPGNPDNAHTITVDRSDVPAHLAHGDYEGRCGDDGQDERVERRRRLSR